MKCPHCEAEFRLVPVNVPWHKLGVVEQDAERVAILLNTTLSGLQKKWTDNQRSRAIAYQVLRALGHSTVKIGRVLKRDHSTIVSASAQARESWPLRVNEIVTQVREIREAQNVIPGEPIE